jgi:hypothetical protein
MSGQIKQMIDKIVEEKSRGNDAIASVIKTKIIFKGVIVNKYDSNSEDDSQIISKLKDIAKDMDVKL